MASQKKIAAASIKKWNNQYTQSAFIYFAMTNPQTNLMDYPQYFSQELGITDNRSYARKLARQGLLKVTKCGTVKLTGEGMKAFDEDDIAFLQLACPHITIVEYRAHKEKLGNDKGFAQVMISLMSIKMEALFKEKELQKVGDLCLEVAQLCEQTADYEGAARSYIKALYYDLKGPKYKNVMADVQSGRCTRLEALRRFDSIYLRPQVIAGLRRVKDCHINSYVEDAICRKKLNFSYCNPELFPKLVGEILDGTYDELNWREHYLDHYKRHIRYFLLQYQKKKQNT